MYLFGRPEGDVFCLWLTGLEDFGKVKGMAAPGGVKFKFGTCKLIEVDATASGGTLCTCALAGPDLCLILPLCAKNDELVIVLISPKAFWLTPGFSIQGVLKALLDWGGLGGVFGLVGGGMVKVRSLGWFLFHLERGFLGWVGGEVFLEFF